MDKGVKYAFQTVTAGTLTADTELSSATISTIKADREGDSVIPEGGDFSNFMKSPVLLWAHGGQEGYSSVPIGSVTNLEVTPGQSIKADWKWLKGDPFAERIKNAWEQGVVRATSIGFRAKEVQPNGVGHDIKTWELLELSLCAIPMNPEAVRSLKSLGLEPFDIKSFKKSEETPVIQLAKPDAPSNPMSTDDMMAFPNQATTSTEDEPAKEAAPVVTLQELLDMIQTIGANVDLIMERTAKSVTIQTPNASSLTDDSIVVKLLDETEETFAVDVADIRIAIHNALRTAVVEPAIEHVRNEVRRAKGRVF